MPWSSLTRARAANMPEPGFFLLRRKGYAPIACRIIRWSDGTWQAHVGQVIHEAHEVWTKAPGVSRIWLSAEMIDEETYRSWLDRAAAVAQLDPDHPVANPNVPVDLRRLAPLF